MDRKINTLGVIYFPDNILHSELKFEYLEQVSASRCNKLNYFRFNADKWRSWGGEYLLCRMLKKEIHNVFLDERKLRFAYNQYGKPFLQDYPQLNFNISHSGSIAVCALSNDVVGIDVEEIKHIDIDEFGNVFSDREKQILSQKKGSEKLDFFYSLWTLKESYIKAIGNGVYIALDSFTIAEDSEKIFIKEDNISISDKWEFAQYDITENYKFSVCVKRGNLPNCIEYYSPWLR